MHAHGSELWPRHATRLEPQLFALHHHKGLLLCNLLRSSCTQVVVQTQRHIKYYVSCQAAVQTAAVCLQALEDGRIGQQTGYASLTFFCLRH